MPAWLAPALAAGGSILGGLASRGSTPDQPGMPSFVEDRMRPYASMIDPRNFNYNPGLYQSQSPFTKMALQRMGNFSNQPSQDYWSSVMQGDYLGGGSEGFQNAVMNPAIQGTNAAFNQLGRFGSQANMENTSEAAARAYAPFYDNERTRMGQAAQMIPQLQAGEIQQQLQAGTMKDQLKQQRRQFNDPSERYLRRMTATRDLLSPLLGLQPDIQGQSGSPWQGAISGGLLGMSLGQNWNSTGGGGSGAPQQSPYQNPYGWMGNTY